MPLNLWEAPLVESLSRPHLISLRVIVRKGNLCWFILMKFFLFEMCVYFLFVDIFPLVFISQRAACPVIYCS